MKRAVVNFAKGAWYPKGQARLRDSLKKVGEAAEFVALTDTNAFGCPSHTEMPYAFKPYALEHARKLGYGQAIFADASVWAVKPWGPVWDKVNEQGYYFEEAGHWTGTWTNDNALAKQGLTRDDAMKIPMFSAGFVGLDFSNETAMAFLNDWMAAARDGSFRGAWTNKTKSESQDPRCQGHRHDMAMASIIAWKHKMKLGSGGSFLAYVGPGYSSPKDSVVAHLQPC